MTLDNILEEIKKANTIAIVVHENPDGDAIGSALAMKLALEQLNKEADVIIPEYPSAFSFLPGVEKIKKESDIQEYDLAIALDCASIKLLNGFAKYFDNAEIIELHHNQKKDAPSGTAVKTAQLMAEANKSFTTGNCEETETIEGARGANSYDNIHIHSVRMPGYMASQEVLFGSDGQILSIRHDSTNRTCYMPGVMMAVKYAYEHKNFTYGLDNIL